MRRLRFGGLTTIAMMIVLAGCFPFGPLPPFGPFPEPGGDDVIVENATDEDWVLRITTDQFPLEYAVPAATTAAAFLYGGSLERVELLDRDCDEVAELALDEVPAAIRIGEGGGLSVSASGADPADAPLVEYYECSGGFGYAEPESGEPVANASGVLIVVGGDGSAWQFEPATATLDQLVAAGSNGLDGEHTVSQDGTRVAFSRYDDDGLSSDLYVSAVDAAPDSAELLADDAGNPAWSPDGSRIAFLDLDPFAGGSTLTVTDADGTGEPTVLAERASAARWSPDGTRLAYIVEEPDSLDQPQPPEGELWVVDADGSDARRLAD
ncbi:MAG: hypothetical protein M3Y40_08945, partial [Chloroflexota bacterium]|nr:hypothetical protein [Chloroflexota bacterium]